MPPLPPIDRIVLARYRQFHHCDIDLREPSTGSPLREVCVLGPNGTGKSTLLRVLHQLSSGGSLEDELDAGFVAARHVTEEAPLYHVQTQGESIWCSAGIEANPAFGRSLGETVALSEFLSACEEHRTEAPGWPVVRSAFFTPETTQVDGEPCAGLEELLRQLLQERSMAYREFLRRPENRDRTVAEADEAFRETRRTVADSLTVAWDKVLSVARLRFDSDNRESLVSLDSGEAVPCSALSRGLRDFLLRLGLVFREYFDSDKQAGIVSLDDPEQGLHPSLCLGLIDLYRSILDSHDTRLFVATHSPLIATQFPATSRVVLGFGENGHIVARPGTAPEGSDPERLLRQDFGVQLTDWQRRVRRAGEVTKLKRAIRQTEDQSELADLLDEVMSLRRR